MTRRTVPLPSPRPPSATVIQLTELFAVHAQPAGAERLKMLSPPGAAMLRAAGDTSTVQAGLGGRGDGGASGGGTGPGSGPVEVDGAWTMVTVIPPTVTVPL